MRWIPFAICSYLFIVLQCSLIQILKIDLFGFGPFCPDIVVIMALYIALHVRDLVDGLIAGWVLGTLLDLTISGPGGRFGLMGIFFILAVYIIFSVREALFRNRALPQMLMGGFFVFLTNGLWVTLQAVLAWGVMSLNSYGSILLQVLMSGLYTALLTPLVFLALSQAKRILFETPQIGRSQR